MEGKIVVYSQQTGAGKIITPTAGKYDFTVEEWNAYDRLPGVGMTVTFTPEGGKARAITPFTPPSKARSTPHEPAARLSKEHPVLRMSVDPQSALNAHFAPVLESITLHKELLAPHHRTIDYDRMQRFLSTAYHNLIEIDPSFAVQALEESLQNLQTVHRLHADLLKKGAHPHNAFEAIFLSRQEGYRQLHERIAAAKDQIEKRKGIAARAEKRLQSLERRGRALSPKDPRRTEYFEEIKALKRTLVDAIHEAGKLEETHRVYQTLLQQFREQHKAPFTEALRRFVHTHATLLKKIQDTLAYRFDAMMWERANRSKPIRHFFTQAGILEDFSAVTYLKYYLKRLDHDKLSLQHRELMQLLHELESEVGHRLLGIDDDPEYLMALKKACGALDNTLRFTPVTRPKSALSRLQSLRPDLVLLNPLIRGIDPHTAIRHLKERLPGTRLLFLAPRITRTLLRLAKEEGVETILPKSLPPEQMARHIRKLLQPHEGAPCLQD